MPRYPYTVVPTTPYAHITNAGTTVIKNSPGDFIGLVINGGSVGATMQFFDQKTTVTGTVGIANITLSDATVAFPQDGAIYNAKTANGLVVVTTGTIDATILYR